MTHALVHVANWSVWEQEVTLFLHNMARIKFRRAWCVCGQHRTSCMDLRRDQQSWIVVAMSKPSQLDDVNQVVGDCEEVVPERSFDVDERMAIAIRTCWTPSMFLI